MRIGNHTGTYRDKKKLLPLTAKDLEKAWDMQTKVRNGLKSHCGHDFWDKEIELGEVVFCHRCHLFFTKIKILPWLTKHQYKFEDQAVYGSNHCDTECYIQVPVRQTDGQ